MTVTESSISHTRAAEYSVGRPPYPDGMFEIISKTIEVNAKALDIGCGNGRGTIPLYLKCTKQVTGFDCKTEMLDELSRKADEAGITIPCKKGEVKELRDHFPYERFQAVIAFSALSLFDTDESIRAIRDVLASDGVFIDAGDEGAKNDPIGQLMREIIKQAINIELPQPHISDEQSAVTRNGFELVSNDELTVVEDYNFGRTFANFRSRTAYPKCSVDQDEAIKQCLSKHFETQVFGGVISIPVTYRVTVYKPKPH